MENKNRELVKELSSEDIGVYYIENDDARADMFKDSLVATFEVESGFKSTVFYNVVFSREKITENENETRKKMREFGTKRLRDVLDSKQKKPLDEKDSANTSPEGFQFVSRQCSYKRDFLMDTEYKNAIEKILDSTVSTQLTNALREEFPSADAMLADAVLRGFKFALQAIKDEDLLGGHNFVRYILKSDSDKYLSLLKHLHESLATADRKLSSADFLQNIRADLQQIDEIHKKYHVRNIDTEPVDLSLSKINGTVSLLDKLYKEKGRFDEVLNFFKSFYSEKDMARAGIAGDIASVFGERAGKIKTRPWLIGGSAAAIFTIVYLLAMLAVNHISIPADAPGLLGWVGKWFVAGSHGEPLNDVLMRVSIFSVLAFVTVFCFRQYTYERKAQEVYAFKQTALNAMVRLLEPHKGDELKTGKIMDSALPHVFSDVNINSEKHRSNDEYRSLIMEIIRSLK